MSKKKSHWRVLNGVVLLFIKHRSRNIQNAAAYVSLKFEEVQSGDINLGVMLSVERMENTEKYFFKKGGGHIEHLYGGIIDKGGTAYR